MAVKRKISIRKVLQVFLTLVVTTGCIIAMVSASTVEDSKKIKGVAVHIKNDKKYHFIEEKEILDLAIYKRNVQLDKTPLSALDVRSIERVILADPWVANAQVFVDKDNVLQLYITQRIPIARLFQQNGQSYYLDSTLSVMPLSGSYVYYTSVVTNVPEIKNDSAGWAMRKDIISLVRAIQSDSFWNAQVSQIVVDSADMFELVPMLGDHRILFGDAVNMKQKFNNLFVFYKNVLNRIGWDKYQVLDIRFNGQVVASPSLPYKGPVDKAVNNMNWINSIVETEAHNDSLHNLDKAARATEPAKEPEKPTKPKTPDAKPANKVAIAAAKKDNKKPDVKKDPKKKPDAKKDAKKKQDVKKDAKNVKDKKKTPPKPGDKNKDKNKQNNKQQTKTKEDHKKGH